MAAAPPPPLPHAGEPFTVPNLVSAVQFGDLPYLRSALDTDPSLAKVKDEGGCSLLHWAAINNRRAIAHLLLQHGADLNYVGGKLQEIPLQWAVRNEKFTGIAQYLIEAGSDLTHRSVNGLDALHVACRMGNVNMAFLILAAGASVNTRDGDGNTTLQYLLKTQAEWDSHDIQRLLLRFGADVTATDEEGNNAMHLMALAGKAFTDGRLALLYVGSLPSNAAVRDLFAAKNKEGMTVYQAAVAAKNTTMMNFWVDVHLKMYMHPAVPTVASSLCTASPFICLYVWGWSLITPLVALAAIMGLSKLTLGSISSSKTGFAWGLIITCETSYFLYVAQHYGAFTNAVVVFIGVSICYTLFQSTMTTTVALPRDADRRGLVEAVALAGVPEGPSMEEKPVDPAAAALGMAPTPVHVPRLCTTCLADKTKATMHCSRCNICVVSLDHHCPFVDNCVGRGNRRVFVFFTFFASFGCLLNAILSWIVQFTITCAEYSSNLAAFPLVEVCVGWKYPFFVVAPWAALFTSCWIFLLFSHQMWMVAAATTTYDLVKGLHDGKGNSLASSWRNLSEFFSTGHFNVQPRKRNKPGCKSCATGQPHSHGHGHAHGHAHGAAAASAFPPPADSAGGAIASMAANTMSSISASVAPMILADTEATPLLDGNEDGAVDGMLQGGGDGDDEEGAFLGSKHKVTAAVVTSSESDAGGSGPTATRQASAAAAAAAAAAGGAVGGVGAYTLLSIAQQSQFMRRLFFAGQSTPSPGEKKKDDEYGNTHLHGADGGGGLSSSSSHSQGAHQRNGNGSISRTSSGNVV